MARFRKYITPEGLDDLYMTGDGRYLTGLSFVRPEGYNKDEELPVFRETAKWLDRYFSAKPSEKLPELRIEGLTPFREKVLEIVKKIPYGCTMTYGEIADRIAGKTGAKKMSAQAVGQAIGWNPLVIIIPCHRVVGKDGRLTGYSGGIENKKMLLQYEKTHKC